ncbi:MAG: hypothetical protein B7733_03090 [Myxococcales bacterium FL481]|nr:MAG: hypothetical protein B7733_03090 [Myxococcales bacterium FL481]
MTNVLGGAFEPALSHDGHRLAYVGYTSTGYDLWTMPFDPSQFLVAMPAADSWPVAPDPHFQPSSWQGQWPSERARRYRAIRTYYPRTLLPSTFEWESIGSITQSGLSTSIQDVLNFHRLIGAFRFQSKRPAGSVAYRYRRRHGAARAGFGRGFAWRRGYPRYVYDPPSGASSDHAYMQTQYEEQVTRVDGSYRTRSTCRCPGRDITSSSRGRWAVHRPAALRGAARLRWAVFQSAKT